jgi:hypothetical protein
MEEDRDILLLFFLTSHIGLGIRSLVRAKRIYTYAKSWIFILNQRSQRENTAKSEDKIARRNCVFLTQSMATLSPLQRNELRLGHDKAGNFPIK